MVICYSGNRNLIQLWVGVSPYNHFFLGGLSVKTRGPSPTGAGALEGKPEGTLRKAPQCWLWRLAGTYLVFDMVFDIATKHILPGLAPPLEQGWDLVGAQRSQGRERESGAHPHTWQVVDCWLWFSWKALKWLSEHSLLGPYILWQGCRDPRGVASSPHPLGCFVGCAAAWHRDPGLRDLLSSQPKHPGNLWPFSVYPWDEKGSPISHCEKDIILSFGKMLFKVLTPVKISLQVPKAKSKSQPLTLSSSNDSATMVRQEASILVCNISLAPLCSHIQSLSRAVWKPLCQYFGIICPSLPQIHSFFSAEIVSNRD